MRCSNYLFKFIVLQLLFFYVVIKCNFIYVCVVSNNVTKPNVFINLNFINL